MTTDTVPAITLVDSTLRDGSHAQRHRFTADEAAAIAGGLDRAGVGVLEISHGDGLGGSSFNYGFSAVDEFALLQAAADAVERARLAVLLLPGVGVRAHLLQAREAGVDVARIATHCTEADIAPQHIGLSRELGMTTVGFLMMAHMIGPEALAEQAWIMADTGAQVVYVTDSAGAMTPQDVAARVAALRERLPTDVEVGVHAHHNLSFGVANSLAAIEQGATWVDGCTCGLGAGAGNAPTEVLVAAADRLGIDLGVDVRAIIDVAEDVVRPIASRLPVVDRGSLLLGYAGIYSSFLLHAERAAGRFGVPIADILLEAAERKAVGGQEDILIEIAAGLAAGERTEAAERAGAAS